MEEEKVMNVENEVRAITALNRMGIDELLYTVRATFNSIAPLMRWIHKRAIEEVQRRASENENFYNVISEKARRQSAVLHRIIFEDSPARPVVLAVGGGGSGDWPAPVVRTPLPYSPLLSALNIFTGKLSVGEWLRGVGEWLKGERGGAGGGR